MSGIPDTPNPFYYVFNSVSNLFEHILTLVGDVASLGDSMSGGASNFAEYNNKAVQSVVDQINAVKGDDSKATNQLIKLQSQLTSVQIKGQTTQKIFDQVVDTINSSSTALTQNAQSVTQYASSLNQTLGSINALLQQWGS